MKSKVILLSCTSYGEDAVYEKIKKGFELLGGLEAFIDKNENIL